MIAPVSITAVAAGGAIGSVLRYLVGVWMPASASVPVGTLTVNVLGSLLIGVLVKQFAAVADPSLWRLALATGFCGGFTTFSAFSIETLQLLQQGRAMRAALYVVLTLGLGVAATWLGYVLAPSRHS